MKTKNMKVTGVEAEKLGRLILYLALIVIPSIMLYKKQIIPESMKIYMYMDNIFYESLYAYWKSIGLVVILVCALLHFTYYIYINKSKTKGIIMIFNNYKLQYICIGIFSLLVLVSAFLSEYQEVVWMGFVAKSEGTIQWLAYIAILIIVLVSVTKVRDLASVINMIFISSFFILGHATLAYFIRDFYNIPLVNEIVTIGTDGFEMTYSGASFFTGPLYNPNYMGSYLAILIPLFMFYEIEWLKGYRWNIYQAWLWFGLFASNSSAGLVGTCGSVFAIMVISKLKAFSGRERKAVILLLTIPLLYVGVAEYSGRGGLIEQETEQLQGLISTKNSTEFGFRDIRVSDDRITVDFNIKTLNMVYKGISIEFVDENDNPLEYTYDTESGEITFFDSDYDGLKIVSTNESTAAFRFGAIKFYMGNDGGKPYISDVFGYRIEDMNVEKVLPGYEKFASGRGFIWSRSIPLLKDSVFIGYGADTYPLIFPQHDIVGKLLGGQKVSTLIDKPHNMYLMIGINFGCVALIIYLIMIISCFIKSSIALWNNSRNAMFTGLLGSFIGHNIAVIFNDSMLSTTTIYFAILGLLIVANKLYSDPEGEIV